MVGSIHPHPTQPNPTPTKNQSHTPEVYQQKFTPENMLFKQEDKPTFANLRLSILFAGGGEGAGPLAPHFSGAFPSLLACCSTSGGFPSGSRCPGQTWSTHPGGKPPPRSLPNLRGAETTKLMRPRAPPPAIYMRNRVMGGDPYKWPKMNGYPLVILASYSTYSGKFFGHRPSLKIAAKTPKNGGAIWAYFAGLCLLVFGRVSSGFGMLKYTVCFLGFRVHSCWEMIQIATEKRPTNTCRRVSRV